MDIKIEKNISLAKNTTFKIGGKARYFFAAKNKEEVIRALKWAEEKKLPFFILGEGSNLLVDDKGFNGLIIKIQNSRLTGRQARFKIHDSKIYAQAGTKLNDLIKLAAKKSLSGLEWAAGLPGALGGAICGNAGAFGTNISDNIKEIEFLDVKSFKTKKLVARKCFFGNKDSIFKKNKNLIILSAVINLKKGDKNKITKETNKNINYRKQRHPLNFPSAGCAFKNPQNSKFSASYFIDKAGLKGKKIGEAQVSEKHANFIVNTGKARAKDVLKLIAFVKKTVKNKFKIDLEQEIQFLPYD